jgi:hypothetical protein
MDNPQTTKKKIYWAGFMDGKLYFALDISPGGTQKFPDHACLYRSRHEAKERFEDVRPVRLVQVRKK